MELETPSILKPEHWNLKPPNGLNTAAETRFRPEA
jgi:hypothetical protein